MIAFTRSRWVLLCLSVIAPVTVAVACATVADDPGDDDCGNTQTDVFNCGACGRPCAQGQLCQAGQCTCTPPYQACGVSCLNLQGDPNNCGSCGTVCPPTASFCSNGVCSATCAQTTCGNLCVNTSNDILNCGACGTVCPMGASCSGSCSCPAGTMLCGQACMASCGSGGTGGATGTGGTTSTGGAGGAAGAGVTGGAAGSGTSGSGGMGPVMKACATKTTLTAPTITDFETYDGTTPAFGPNSWIFTMGPMTAPVYAGLYALSENTVGETPPAAYTLAMAAGASSNWAARAVNMMTTDWGGGIGMWMGCVNASAYTGISFMVRGVGPAGMANISLAMEDATAPDTVDPAGGGTCDPAPTDGCAGPTYTFPITVDWTPITVPWASFTAGRGASGVAIVPTGDEITGISFGVNINYVPNPVDGGMPAYVPEPASFEIAIDNLAFTP